MNPARFAGAEREPWLSASAASVGFRLTYAITPPNQTTPRERRRALASAQSARISELPIDALLIYDVQDEAARNGSPRPFPFIPKVDPLTYAFGDLTLAGLPRVVYRALANQDDASLGRWLDALHARGGSAVLVGAPSRHTSTALTLSEALLACRRRVPDLALGGVVIPERHRPPTDEVARVWTKMQRGCRFFVSQTVWSVPRAQRLLSDLCQRADREGRTLPPIALTFSPCGSPQTLEFLAWLGVEIPEPVKRELYSAKDMLARSIDLAADAFAEIHSWSARAGFSIGCNVESVSSRAAEVEASVELVRRIDQLRITRRRDPASPEGRTARACGP
ncbi:MAG TPA: hypothetical protein VI197_21465 [Polyangiaceae bacterium]